MAKNVQRKKHHPENVNSIVDKDWMGGAIYGNVFASRAHFLDHTRDFETRLAAAKAIKPGPGVLVFCGTGFAWHKSNLEDFADFYLTRVHRNDDAFALMEQHNIKEKKIKLLLLRHACGYALVELFSDPSLASKARNSAAESMGQRNLKSCSSQSRNIDHFAFLRRHIEVPQREEFHFPIRGPRFILPPPKALEPGVL
jgi:hypothetical protein